VVERDREREKRIKEERDLERERDNHVGRTFIN
jgi:hypothetical protein